MKVQCDVCEKAQATLLCCADEASLCAECDMRVHAANKLASKHQRVPLLYPSPEDLPCCDICQEKTGYFFCLEDRALLCRNCDVSIHLANTLAANHKRFLVSGVRAALQVTPGNGPPLESTQTRSPMQVSSPATTHASQFSSLTMQASQLSSPRSALIHTQKIPRMASSSASNMIKSPCENSSLLGNGFREEFLSKVPKEEQEVAAPTTPQRLLLVGLTGVFPSKAHNAFTTTLPSASLHQQNHPRGGRQLSDWSVRANTDMNSQDVGKGETSVSQRGGGGGGMGRSSISEYLTEAIPGWRVDELLNLPDVDSMYNSPRSGAAQTDMPLFRSEEWVAEDDAHGLEEAVIGEVPTIPSPLTASGAPGKSVKEPDLDFLVQVDSLAVPDIKGSSSPTSLFPSSLSRKRRRALSEFDVAVFS